MTRIIHIAGNSGSGKSVLALNLGLALNQKGRDVLLFDSNIYSPDISNYSDINANVFLNEYLSGDKNIDEIVTYHPTGMKMVSSIMEEEVDEEKHNKINNALLDLVGKAEIILVDSFSHNPALFSMIDPADETIFVTNDDFPSIVKSKDFIRKMESEGKSIMGIVLNRKRKNSNIKHIESILGKRVLAEIPHHDDVIHSINTKQPIFISKPKSDVSNSIEGLAGIIDTWNKK
jgi:MinD-like ATPase involved in chromosome partitioning or flagellar assembly